MCGRSDQVDSAVMPSAQPSSTWMVSSAALFVFLSNDFYLHFALTRPVIDGGPLGFREAR